MRAAAQGTHQAQNNLGVMYEQGDGVTKDIIRAHMWYSIAVANGSKDAVTPHEHYAKKLSPDQLAQAADMVQKCVSSHYADCGE